jgi:uncharacterized protein YqgC (DUF456 family)
MTTTFLAALVFTLFYLVGLAGVILPALPGVPMVALGALLAAWITGFEVLTWTTVIITALLTVLAQGLDYVAAAVGAKRFGGSRAGFWGSIVGALLGLFVPPFGFIIGALVGAVGAELLTGRPLDEAWRAGIGAFVGTLGGMLVKFIIIVTIGFLIYPRFF